MLNCFLDIKDLLIFHKLNFELLPNSVVHKKRIVYYKIRNKPHNHEWTNGQIKWFSNNKKRDR